MSHHGQLYGLFYYYYSYYCVYVYVCVHGWFHYTYMKVKGEHVKAGSLYSRCWFWISNSGHLHAKHFPS